MAAEQGMKQWSKVKVQSENNFHFRTVKQVQATKGEKLATHLRGCQGPIDPETILTTAKVDSLDLVRLRPAFYFTMAAYFNRIQS